MSPEEAVAALNALNVHDADNEIVHDEADKILLALVPPEVAEAWNQLEYSVGFWYA